MIKLPPLSVSVYAGGLLIGLGMVALYGAIEVSSTPGFCGSCHVMNPYYDSWKSSSHAQIACVDCHIAPGVTAELRKKYEAVAMVASYITGTYGTNPWTEVEDAACLECHQRRLLGGQEVFGDVLFDHRPHLSELRRGKRLKCTSCHSQIVQGSHIAVTVSTCILCHFKDQAPDAGTARCTVCHLIPGEVVDAEGLRFAHADVERFGMPCQSCHVPPPPGEGRVPRERCITCHNEPARLVEYENGDLLHQNHVTEHKVECTNCHLEIRHVTPRHLEATRTACTACHGAEHSPQLSLYAGLGGKGVRPRPDAMYRAGVRCEGCHADFGDGVASSAGEVSCMSCHGPDYRRTYLTWSETLRQRSAALRRQVDASAASFRASPPPPEYADAVANLELVERGEGMHNFPYSISLLGAAHRQLNAARQRRGMGPLRAPWPVPPYESPCLNCHAGVESIPTQAFGRRFPHQPHIIIQGLECTQCHPTHEERDAGERLRVTAGDCSSCHHGDASRACLDCHRGVLSRTVRTETGEFDHSFHVVDMEQECTLCHGSPPGARADRDVCSECH